MEKIRREQQRKPRLKAVNPNQPPKKPVLPSAVNPLLRLLQKYPLLMVGGLWVGLLIMAAIALNNLMLSDRLTQSESATTTAVEINSAQNADTEGKVPLWVFGAIALTCAGGSWMILQQMKPPKRRRPPQRSKAQPPSRQPASRQSDSPRQQRQPNPVPQRAIPAWGNQGQPKRPKPPAKSASNSSATPTNPVNPKISNLADHMDIRKRQSTSSQWRNR